MRNEENMRKTSKMLFWSRKKLFTWIKKNGIILHIMFISSFKNSRDFQQHKNWNIFRQRYKFVFTNFTTNVYNCLLYLCTKAKSPFIYEIWFTYKICPLCRKISKWAYWNLKKSKPFFKEYIGSFHKSFRVVKFEN